MRISRGTRGSTAALALAAALVLGACTGDDDPGGEASPTAATTAPGGSPTPSGSPSGPASPSASPDDRGDDDTTDGTTDDTTDDTTGDEPARGTSPFPANAEPDTSEPSGDARLTVTDIRVGEHDGYDRVVFDLGGAGTPGWRVEYVDEAIDDGSGNPVEVDGDAILQVVISGTAMPADSGVEEYDGTTLAPDDTEAVEEVVYRFWFEGYTTAFVGVDDERKPFRVFSLTEPARVVVDVQH
jgi:hypothetical protein